MTSLRGLKVLITAGGIGTRLLPYSKEIPKEMSPIILRDTHGSLQVKPIIQAIFEQLHRCGARDFFIIVGRGKRAIEDHFTPDLAFIDLLKKRGKKSEPLEKFYRKIASSNLVFISQPDPLGFGAAVLRAKPHIAGEFLLQAGDTYIISQGERYLHRLIAVHRRHRPAATILYQELRDPRQHGVIAGDQVEQGIIRIRKAVEKPTKPESKLAILPVYIFDHQIFDTLVATRPGKGGEVQLTDGIQKLINSGKVVLGVKVGKNDLRLDIGSPETFMEALDVSRKYSRSKDE